MKSQFPNIQKVLDEQRKFVKYKQLWDIRLRMYYLKELKNKILEKKDKIIAAINSDLGKDSFKAQFVEVDKTVTEIDALIKNITKWSKPEKVTSPLLCFPAKSYIYYEPYGHSLIFAPWNYPFNLAMVPLAGSLAAGNSVLLKPSEISFHTSKIIYEIVTDAFPKQVAAVIEGGVEEATYLLEQRFDHIFYTGSTGVGRIVMEKAAKHLTPVVLELGGKAPAIVHTREIDLAAKRIVFGKFFNCGQTCLAPDYVLIPEKDKQEFIDSADKWIKVFYKDVKETPDYGRIINENHFKRLERLVDQDCKISVGGEKSLQDKFWSPTIVECDANAKIMQEEIFGPILPIIISDKLDNSIEFVNNREKPLACYAFVDGEHNVDKVIDSISAGGMVFNDTLIHFINGNLPFGGVGASGMGNYHGPYSFRTFSHQKSVMKTNYHFENSLRYPPYKLKKSLVLKLGRLFG